MRTIILKRASRAFGQAHFIPQSRGVIVMVALLLAAANLFASPAVTTLAGGNPNVGYAGYEDGNTLNQALFHTPSGIALDSTGQYLYVADRDNNAIRYLDLVAGYTWTFINDTNLINKPIAVAVDIYDYVYVLNRRNVTNGSVVTFDNWGDAVATNAVKLTNAAGMAMDFTGNIYVTVQSNTLIRITPAGVRNTIAVITNAGTSLQGIVVKFNGLIAACDSGNNGIWLINPGATNSYSPLAGFHGAGDFNTNGNNITSSTKAMFNQPMCVAEAGDGTLIVTDNGNNRVKAVLTSGVVTNLYGVTCQYWGGYYPGWYDSPPTVSVPDSVIPNVQSRLPFGVVMASDGSFYTTEDYYHIIRHVTGAGLMPPRRPPPVPIPTATAGYGQVILTWTASSGATNYNIKRSLSSSGPFTNTFAITTATTYTDTNIVDGTTYYYVVSAVGNGVESVNSSEVSATPLFSPTPTILLPVTTSYGQVSLTWSTSAGATSYNVKRSTSTNAETTIASTASTSYNDTTVLNGTTYYYVVSALNPGGESANSLEVSATPPVPPPPAPSIGWFDYEGNNITGFLTVLYPVSGTNTHTANNDLNIAVNPNTTAGVATYYIYTNGPQPVLAVPSPANGSTPPYYKDGLNFAQSLLPTFIPTMPDLVIKALNIGPGGSSAVVTAEFLFQVANPTITGNNAALFTVSDITTNVVLWYTIDGTVPTNTSALPSTSIGPITITNGNSVKLSINASSNILFQARAFRNGYSPSGIAVQSFSPSNFVANAISFGLTGGEPASKFLARPGQFFYAPVTLQLIDPSDTMFSLQFNAAVTNGLTTPNKIVNGAGINFFPMLMTQVPVDEGRYYPPADGNWYLGIPNVMFSSVSNGMRFREHL